MNKIESTCWRGTLDILNCAKQGPATFPRLRKILYFHFCGLWFYFSARNVIKLNHRAGKSDFVDQKILFCIFHFSLSVNTVFTSFNISITAPLGIP